MNMRIAKAATTPAPVEVTITVTRFQDVLGSAASGAGRGTRYTMKLARRDPRAFIKGEDLHLKAPGAAVRFTIAAGAGSKAAYYPVGIAFVRDGAGDGDEQRLGLVNFPQDQIRPAGRSLVIVDSYRDTAPHVRYKFSVVVQRGADGRIGIIDPGIVHEDEQ